MFLLTKKAQERQRFSLSVIRRREQEKQENHQVFNKRSFIKDKVTITKSISNILQKNESRDIQNEEYLNKYQLKMLEEIVEALDHIHHGEYAVKEALANVVTAQKIEAYECVMLDEQTDINMEKYHIYIASGEVEVVYNCPYRDSLHHNEPNLVYPKKSGEYIGNADVEINISEMVLNITKDKGGTEEYEELDNPNDDVVVPTAGVYAKEDLKILIVDMKKVATLAKTFLKRDLKEKWGYLNNSGGILTCLSHTKKVKLLPLMKKKVKTLFVIAEPE